jgi:hypothetical protein
MSNLGEPRFETRRRADLRDELVARAKAWLPDWRPLDYTSDFAGALFEIAARLESEVAQRLDKMPEKMFRDFLTWLGVRGQAAQAARLPLVFNLTANSERVLAHPPIQVQATPPPSASGGSAEPVTFETEEPVMIVPGTLAALNAVDPVEDAFYRAPDGFSALDPPTPGPKSWTVKTLATGGSTQIQLDPALGLDALPTLLDPTTNLLYRVTKAEGGLVTVDPPVGTADPVSGAPASSPQDLPANRTLTLQTTFDPFGAAHRNLQEHALYIGSESLLNLPTAATIRITELPAGSTITWSYWGKSGTGSSVGWQQLDPPDPTQPVLTLNKHDGSVEIREIDAKSSRWLKGTVPPKANAATQVTNIELVVNPKGCGQTAPCPPGANMQSTVAVQGIANTTPLVLNTTFYPLGREPRLFDAFYLGCPEAFSKPNASVQICLEAQEGTSNSFTAAQATTSNSNILLFGVGNDHFLHRMQPTGKSGPPVNQLTAVQPPVNQAGKHSGGAAPASLIASQGRLSTCTRTSDTLVAAAADSGIWIWSEDSSNSNGTWYFLGNPDSQTISEATTTNPYGPAVLLLLDTPNIHVVAEVNGTLYEAVLATGWETAGPASWTPVPLPPGSPANWATIAPIFDPTTQFQGTSFGAPSGWIGVATNGSSSLFVQNANRSKLALALPAVDPTLSPLAVLTGAHTFLLTAKTPPSQLSAWTVDPTGPTITAGATVTADVGGNSFDWMDTKGTKNIAVVFGNNIAGSQANLAIWYPQAATTSGADESTVYVSQPPVGGPIGSPAVTSNYVFAPGPDAAIITMSFDVNGLSEIDIPDTPSAAAQLATALVVQNTAPDHPLKGDIVVSKLSGAGHVALRLTSNATLNPMGVYWIKAPGSEADATVDAVHVYREEPLPSGVSAFSSSAKNTSLNGVITRAIHDPNTHAAGDRLYVHVPSAGTLSVQTIKAITVVSGKVKITLTRRIPGISGPAAIEYNYVSKVDLGTPALLPLIDQLLTTAQVSQVAAGGAYFVGGQPAPNLMMFQEGATPTISAILQRPWPTTTRPTSVPIGGSPNFVLITSSVFDQLVVLLVDKTTNPSLSWEYFDGQAWRTVPGLTDTTSSLRSTGVISFCVPADLQATSVAGQNSNWIRARLVGGDYGQETVTVLTVPDTTTGGTKQTVIRDLSTVSPPVLVSVNLSYSLCCPAAPDYVITSDGGEMIDQTAANKAGAAQVVLFTALADSIPGATSSTTPDSGKNDRAIYLGFDGEISGGPINLLFFVEDQDFGDDAFPLQVDVLRETGFEHVVPGDNTRALGETGIVSINLVTPPPPTSLFGAEDLRWLRLRPSARFATPANWTPRIRLAYVNGVFARASQTQTLERLGSSDGSPSQVVTLARPPVLEGSLELRVLEPLEDEAVQALLKLDPRSVVLGLANGQTGPWVLWKEIPILEEAGKSDRSYALDSDTGDISFGDAIHGAIPPIGTDSIVAVTYKVGGGAAANNITAWSQVSPTSPVQGVERVVAPDDAAGGSDPETPDEVIRLAPANQFIRDRALSIPDFETLALESSRDIVQARASSSAGGIRLIAVTRLPGRVPTQAQWRALLSYLGDRTSPGLAAANAIIPVPPRLVSMQMQLMLTIRSVEFSGSVDQDVTDRIVNLLDPATGGLDQQGWPLGTLPTETDIAAALIGTPNLEAVESVTISASFNNSVVQTARPEDLPIVSPEDIQVQFDVVEVEVGA